MAKAIVAVDFHCSYQKVLWLELGDGEIREADLCHEDRGEVEAFYGQFEAETVVGMEVSGYSYWFEDLLREMGLRVKVAHTLELRARRRRRQKNDRRDAHLLLELLQEGTFPEVWRPDRCQREQKAVIRHRVRLVREQNRVGNVLRALVYNCNVRIRAGALSQAAREEIAAVGLGGELSEIRDELLQRYCQLSERIEQLDGKIRCWAELHQEARRLMTIPGIGATTALCLVLTVGPIERFASARKLTAYLGLDVMEYSSDNRNRARRFGSISKQGDRLLRFLLGQCATVATRHNPEMRRVFLRLKQRKNWAVARTAVARRLLVCCYVLLRDGIDYREYVRRGAMRGSACPDSWS